MSEKKEKPHAPHSHLENNFQFSKNVNSTSHQQLHLSNLRNFSREISYWKSISERKKKLSEKCKSAKLPSFSAKPAKPDLSRCEMNCVSDDDDETHSS